jgi:hypothetical protein
MDLAELIDTFQDAITDAVLESYPPLYSARNREYWGYDLARLKRRPLGAQGDAIRAVALSLQRHQGTNLVGEMGTGKTTIGVAAAYLAGFRRTIVLCPPHLVRKWQREILATVPAANAVIVKSITDLKRLPQDTARPLYVVLSREQAKLSYRWQPAVIERPVTDAHGVLREDDGDVSRRICCPVCFDPVLDGEGLPLDRDELERKKLRCDRCSSPLWQADREGPRRYPLADYIARYLPGFFDLLIVDEQHEYKARGSAQGIAAGNLANACGRTLTLTGTLMGGYSSTLFYLLWRFSPGVREEFGHNDEPRWVGRYGLVERITRKGDDDDPYEDGRTTRRRSYRTRTIEKPGVSPAVLFHLIGNTVFLRLADVASDLPEYSEQVRLVELDGENAGEAPSQCSCYQRLAGDLHAAVTQALARGSKRLLAAYLQCLLAYPDACTKGEAIIDHDSGHVVATAPPLPEDRLYPKEEELVELVAAERRRGRRVLVYITHTASRDISPRVERVLRDAGLRVLTLKADTVAPDRREDWVSRRVGEGLDALIVHPRLVQTGLDLIDFPTICWYETEYSVYTMRQASRRSWRIGQRQPVQVIYYAYGGTLQAQALSLVARKLKASLAVEGELVEDGLAGHGDDGEDMLLALAKSLTEQVEASSDSLERLFAEAQGATSELEAGLNPDDFEPEPDRRAEADGVLPSWDAPPGLDLPLFESVAVRADQHANCNGHRLPEIAAPASGEQLRLL